MLRSITILPGSGTLFLVPLGTTLVASLFFRARTSWSVKGRNLLTYDRILRSFVDIDLGPMSVVLGHISVGKNRFYRTFRNTSVTIDAGVSVDIKTIS